uniref:Uncharacterized protein n=1 Tax=Anguilla anguilla TaxID=7936 RepID=A0A0E9QMV9_ANGAN
MIALTYDFVHRPSFSLLNHVFCVAFLNLGTYCTI